MAGSERCTWSETMATLVPNPGLPVAVNALAAGGVSFTRGRVYARSATVYVLAGADSDHIDSLELREYGEPGAALFWLDRRQGDVEKLLLRTDFGVPSALLAAEVATPVLPSQDEPWRGPGSWGPGWAWPSTWRPARRCLLRRRESCCGI